MSDSTPAEILAEIRTEREALEKLQTTLGQRRRGDLCGAKTSAGPPCRRLPIRGGNRCIMHGGGSPLARQEAERRLLYGASLALDRLLDALSEHEHDGPCALCGCNPSSRDPNTLRAAIALLDRSGFGPGLKLTAEHEQRIGEVRVTIVEPDPEQLAEYEASDRAVAAAVERNAYNQELEEPKPEPEPEDDRHTVSFNLETDR